MFELDSEFNLHLAIRDLECGLATQILGFGVFGAGTVRMVRVILGEYLERYSTWYV